MQRITMRYFLLGLSMIMVSVAVLSCSEEEEQTVDQEYLDSQEYSSFKDDANTEIKENAEASKTLSQDLQKVAECTTAEQLSIPLSTNEDDLAEWLQSASKECQLENEVRTITLLGSKKITDVNMQLVLFERQTVYTDDELIAVTYNGDELLSFTTVGIYQKNPTREITSDVRFEKDGDGILITSVTNRKIKYPIDQENRIETLYKVDGNGGIEEL